jgi:hypothetical protein
MAGLLEEMRKKSGAFPLRLNLQDLPQDGWRFRIYVSTNQNEDQVNEAKIV